MKNRQLVLDRLDRLKNNISSIRYLVNTNGNFQEILESFEKTFQTLEDTVDLVSIEQDFYKIDQVI